MCVCPYSACTIYLQAAAAAAATAEPAIGIDEGKRDGSGAALALSPEKQTQQQLQQGKFAWASSSALTDCSVCLEAYRDGDRVCRLPCAHAFHASVSVREEAASRL